MFAIRRHLVPLAVATATVFATGAVAAATGSDTSTPTTSDAPADAALTLLDSGDPATAVVITNRWITQAEVGATVRSAEQTSFTGTAITGGATIDLGGSSELVELRTVESFGPDGGTVLVVVEDYTAEIDNEPSASFAANEPRSALIGIPALVTYDGDGLAVNAVRADGAEATGEQLFALEDLVDANAMPFPTEPVGVGARWSAPFDSEGDERSMIADYEVIEITDTHVTVAVTADDLSNVFGAGNDLEITFGPDAGMSAWVTFSLDGQPLDYSMESEIRMQGTFAEGSEELVLDLTMRSAATLTIA